MARNSLGKNFSVTSFGESHGPAIGVVIDGIPAGFTPDLSKVQQQLNRRKPGQSALTTQRTETDEFKILSGLFEGKTTGSPLTLIIENQNAKSADYEALKNVYRPSHADYTYEVKYGFRDYRGGGRSSARITAGWVAAGAIAEQYLQQFYHIEILAFVNRIYNIVSEFNDLSGLSRNYIDRNAVRCPDDDAVKRMIEAIEQAKEEKDSLGGSILCIANNLPAGLGEPVFGKLQAELGKAMLSIPAVKGIEFGEGIASTYLKGSQNNDAIALQDDKITTLTNRSGGLTGGISNGEPLFFTTYFKPVSSIGQSQQTVDRQGNNVSLKIEGRHDPCVLPRAVPIIESLAAIVLLDLILESKSMI